MKKQEIHIGIYKTGHEKADSDILLKSLERFVYSFKILMRASYKKDALFYSPHFILPEISGQRKAIDFALLVPTDETMVSETFVNEVEKQTGKGKTLLVCFDRATYQPLREQYTGMVYPLFYAKSSGETVTFEDVFTEKEESEKLLFLRVFDVIDAINEKAAKSEAASPSKETVFLALTDEKLAEERSILKRELKRLGYDVAPDTANMKKDDYNGHLKEAIEKSKLSIHLIHPDDTLGVDRSLLAQQNEWAYQKYKSSEGTFSRILWIAGADGEQEDEFLDKLKENPEELQGAEVLQNSIETLRGLLKHKLNGRLAACSSDNRGHANPDFKVYFLYDRIDRESAEEMVRQLKIKAGNLMQPLFKGDFYQLRHHHLHCLKEADIVVVFVEKVNPMWLQMKFLEILKSPGMGRKKKWTSQIIFLNNDQKIDWLEANQEVTVLANDIKELARKIELGRKMLNDEV